MLTRFQQCIFVCRKLYLINNTNSVFNNHEINASSSGLSRSQSSSFRNRDTMVNNRNLTPQASNLPSPQNPFFRNSNDVVNNRKVTLHSSNLPSSLIYYTRQSDSQRDNYSVHFENNQSYDTVFICRISPGNQSVFPTNHRPINFYFPWEIHILTHGYRKVITHWGN